MTYILRSSGMDSGVATRSNGGSLLFSALAAQGASGGAAADADWGAEASAEGGGSDAAAAAEAGAGGAAGAGSKVDATAGGTPTRTVLPMNACTKTTRGEPGAALGAGSWSGSAVSDSSPPEGPGKGY